MKVYQFVVICFSGFLILLTGCTAGGLLTRPPLEEQGAAYLYLKPLSPESERLTFSLHGISAVKESGEETPLTLNLQEISVRSVSRERLLAFGELPPGRYRGLSFKARKASLAGEVDNAALLSPEDSGRIDIPFLVTRKKATVLSLTFRYAESLRSGVIFNPFFTVVPAGKTAVGLLGFSVNRGSNTITVFDKVSGHVSGVIPTGAAPGGMVIDPGRSRAYVALSGDDAVEVIDLLEGETIDRARLAGGDRPVEVALTPDGKTLLAVNSGSNTVSFIDPVSLIELARIGLGDGPRSILLDSTGRRAYVFNTLGSTISVIDVPNRMVASTIATESGPLRGQFNRRGDRLYVIHQWSPYLLVIDPFSLSTVRRQHIGLGFLAMKVDATTDRIYMARKGGREIEVLDPFTLVTVQFLQVGGEVSYMTIDGQEKSLLLAMPVEKTLRIVDLARSGTRAEIDLEDAPFWVTVMGER